MAKEKYYIYQSYSYNVSEKFCKKHNISYNSFSATIVCKATSREKAQVIAEKIGLKIFERNYTQSVVEGELAEKCNQYGGFVAILVNNDPYSQEKITLYLNALEVKTDIDARTDEVFIRKNI